jgi:hypothetical protein
MNQEPPTCSAAVAHAETEILEGFACVCRCGWTGLARKDGDEPLMRVSLRMD